MTKAILFENFMHKMMRNAGFTKQERSFTALMRIWAVLFFLSGVLFAIAPDYATNYLFNLGLGIFNWQSAPFPEGSPFWVVMSVGLLFTLSYLCLVSQRNLVRNIGYVRPVILANLVGTLGFFICFIMYDRQFPYLVATIIDGLIFLVTWRSYRRALRSRV